MSVKEQRQDKYDRAKLEIETLKSKLDMYQEVLGQIEEVLADTNATDGYKVKMVQHYLNPSVLCLTCPMLVVEGSTFCATCEHILDQYQADCNVGLVP